MKREELWFERPAMLNASQPPELGGRQRDEVRLLVSTQQGHTHHTFRQLADLLQPGDLLVVNDSATLPASVAATGAQGDFILNFATNYGAGLWLAEPRYRSDQPGPLPLRPGETIFIGNQPLQLVSPFPGQPRLWYVQSQIEMGELMQQRGQAVRYGYIAEPLGLPFYQTIFARVPGSAEMPSAGRPFSERVLESLRQRGVQIAAITLHTGVSSLEVETDEVEDHPLFAESFHVPVETAQAVNAAKSEGRRVIAVGTTVIRALEAAWDGRKICPARGFTRLYVHPTRGVHTVDGLITGFHDPFASHLAMLYAVAGQPLVRSAYEEAVKQGYLWHEFGDSHLILP